MKEMMKMSVELTKKYLRIRVKNPKKFRLIRTDDIGRKGHSLRLAGVNKKTGRWETQAWLIDRKDIQGKDIRALLLLNGIIREAPRKQRAQILQKLKSI